VSEGVDLHLTRDQLYEVRVSFTVAHAMLQSVYGRCSALDQIEAAMELLPSLSDCRRADQPKTEEGT